MSRRHVPVPREHFVVAVHRIIERGEYPNGAKVNAELARGGRYLAPIECQWRREAAAAVGFRLHGRNLDGSKGQAPARTERKRPRRHLRPKAGDA